MEMNREEKYITIAIVAFISFLAITLALQPLPSTTVCMSTVDLVSAPECTPKPLNPLVFAGVSSLLLALVTDRAIKVVEPQKVAA